MWYYFLPRCHPQSMKGRIKPSFFDSESLLYALWEKNGVTKTIDFAFGQTPLLPLPLTCIRTLSLEPNLKMSTILFVLHYIRYKGRVKSRIWDSQVHSWSHRQVGHQLQCHACFSSHFFSIFYASKNETLGAPSSAT